MSDDLVKQARDFCVHTPLSKPMITKLADRIEQLIEEGSVMAHMLDAVEANLRVLFQLLDKTEETDDGRSFHPNQLRSCRALDAEKLSKILAQLKNMVEGKNT